LIPNVYLDWEHRFWDHLITYFVSVLGIFAITATLKKYYKIQKEENEKKSLKLLEVNHMLQNSNEQKNKVIALISHDIRSPLNSIVSILEFVKAGELDDEELSLVRKELLTITSHTTKMLDNILEWAAFEIQDRELNIVESDIKSACESVVTVFAILASHKDITFKTEYRDNPVVKTDLSRVILIVRNLVQNAIKFTPTGGKITFSVQQVGEKVKISVSDSGIGLSGEKLENLFLLDIQATYGTEREKGTGLGLYLSNENAKKIGADISVRSEESQGATFTLTLPQSPEH
jgi:two-component system sensor histidine kinase/response regulator